VSEARFETRGIHSLARPGWVEVAANHGSRVRTRKIFSEKQKNIAKAPGVMRRRSTGYSDG
jgi:hypothetical protein